MTIPKNCSMGHLKIKIVDLCGVNVLLPKSFRAGLCVVSMNDMERMLRDNPLERGAPRYAALDRDTGHFIVVFPRADKRYRLCVIGTQYVEQ